MRYKRLEIDNGAHGKSVWLLKDDGYRFYVRWVSGPEINCSPDEWVHVMEYKHCELPHLAEEAVANLLMAHSFET